MSDPKPLVNQENMARLVRSLEVMSEQARVAVEANLPKHVRAFTSFAEAFKRQSK